ncbi:MAG: hemolysin family protein [Oscillospiraceae bacterium]
MDDVGRYLWGAVLFILLTLIAMFFSSSEVAIVAMNESKLRRLSEDGNAKAKKLLKLKEHQFDFTLWASTSAMICTIAASFIGTINFAPLFKLLLNVSYFGDSKVIDNIAITISFIMVTFISIIAGMTLPKKLTAHSPDGFAFRAVTPLKALSYLFKPLTWLILKLTRVCVRIFGVNPNLENADITEEEIRMLVDAGNVNGTIELSEREMINNIFEFDDRTAGDVMTHRTDLWAVSKSDNLSEVLKIVIDEGFSRIPVYEEDIDDIVGIIYAKDLLALIGAKDLESKKIEDFMRGVIYVPESTKCRMLFRQFTEKKTHLAVIVDEYGGTAGIVTMEDLLESIVGNIQDEYDQEDEEINKIDDNTYSLDGGVLIDDVERLFGIDLVENEDSDTLGGLIANTLGRIPSEDETPTVTIENIVFTVLLVEERRIVRVKAHRLSKEELNQEEE